MPVHSCIPSRKPYPMAQTEKPLLRLGRVTQAHAAELLQYFPRSTAGNCVKGPGACDDCGRRCKYPHSSRPHCHCLLHAHTIPSTLFQREEERFGSSSSHIKMAAANEMEAQWARVFTVPHADVGEQAFLLDRSVRPATSTRDSDRMAADQHSKLGFADDCADCYR